MKCNNINCENFEKQTDMIAMYQVDKIHSTVFEWNEVSGLGKNLDLSHGESYSESDAEEGRKLPYIRTVECNHCGEVLIDF